MNMDILKFIKQKKFTIPAATLLCLLALHSAEAHQRDTWRQTYYFGEVRSVTSNRIAIADPDILERTVFLSDATVVVRGRETIELPAVGDRVAIVEGKDEYGKDKAVFVRVFDNVVTLHKVQQ